MNIVNNSLNDNENNKNNNSLFLENTETNFKNSSKQKVLIISYYFPPIGLSGVQRTMKFVKYLPDFNWMPIVLTTGATNYYAFDESLLDEISNKEIKIYRTERDPFNPKNNNNNNTIPYPSFLKQKFGKLFLQTIFIPDSRIGWKKYAIKLGETIIKENFDISLIFATAPPFTDFLVAQVLSQKFNIPFVVDYRDLWVDNPQYFFPTPIHLHRHLTLESSVLRQSNKVFVISRTMKEKLMMRYNFLSYKDITVLPHGYDAEDFNVKNDNDKNYFEKNKLIITHCGLFPDDRTPKYFLKAMSKLFQLMPEARQNIQLRFIGIMRKKHSKLVKKYKLEELSVLTGYLPHREAVDNIKKSDVLWMMLKNSIETPGRLYEYIGSNKPLLLMVPDGDLKQIGIEYKGAFITKPKDIDEIIKQLVNIYSLWKKNELPKPNSNFVKSFDRYYLTSVLAKEMSFAVGD